MFEEPFNVTATNVINGYQAISSIHDIDYRALLEGMYQVTQAEGNNNVNAQSETVISDTVNRLKEAKNIILRGAPGTGKTYLAQQVAATLISNGRTDDITELSDIQQKQMAFVQFHPSYDYTDFVEGLRPEKSKDGIAFGLKSGTFMEFCNKAKNDATESDDNSLKAVWNEFVNSIGDREVQISNFTFRRSKGSQEEKNIRYTFPGGSTEASMTLENVQYYLDNGKWNGGKSHSTYEKRIFEKYIEPKLHSAKRERSFVFIID